MRSPTILPVCSLVVLLAWVSTTVVAFAPLDRKACLKQPQYKYVPTKMDPSNPRASFAAMMRKMSQSNSSNNNQKEEQGTIKRIFSKTSKAVRGAGSFVKDKVVSVASFVKNKVVNIKDSLVTSKNDENDKTTATIVREAVEDAKDRVVDKASKTREELHDKAEEAQDTWDEKTPGSAKEAGEKLGEKVDDGLDTLR